MSRYKSTGAFRIESSWSFAIDGELVEVIIDVADALDTRTNTLYMDGCYRVRVTNKQAVPTLDLATKRKYGEQAWSWADRRAWDLQAVIRQHRGHLPTVGN